MEENTCPPESKDMDALPSTHSSKYMPGWFEKNLIAARSAPPLAGFLGGFGQGAYFATLLGFGLLGLELGTGLGHLVDIPLALLGGLLLLSSGGLAVLTWRFLGWLVLRLAERLDGNFTGRLLRSLRRGWEKIPFEFWGGAVTPYALVLLGLFGGSALQGVPVISFHLLRLLIPVGSIIGGLSGLALARGIPNHWRRGLGGAALCLILIVGGWLIWPGSSASTAKSALMPYKGKFLAIADPGQPGRYPTRSLSYGSGIGRRSIYTSQATLHTPTVDVTPALSGFGGIAGVYHRIFFGFDFSSLPLNALVWYPEGQGPFPLFLLVHGNHNMGLYSEPGYAYLGEHLASHGYIVVSVDENFLNGGLMGDMKSAEMPVRGWMLLKHLQQWQAWNEEPSNPFYQKVDLENIILGGHSRGGEAVQHAWLINQKAYSAISDLVHEGEFGFNIRALIVIAPADGHFQPDGKDIILKDVNYFLINGGHDSDVSVLWPIRTYNRVSFTPGFYGFKAMAYLYTADHAGFNTVWERSGDRGRAEMMLINQSPILDSASQQAAAKTLITSFLEAAIRRQDQYRQIFQNPAAAQPLLPPGLLLTDYQDGKFQAVLVNERPYQLKRVELEGAVASAAGFRTWERRVLKLRDLDSEQGNMVLHLGWDAGAQPIYRIALPEGTGNDFKLTINSSLAFQLGPAGDWNVPCEIEVELTDAAGEQARLPLNQFGALYPPLSAQIMKSERVSRFVQFDLNVDRPVEELLQSYTLPLEAFVQANPRFQPGAITGISWYFDGSQGGEFYLDTIGFR